MKNTELKVNSLDEITPELFRDAILLAYSIGTTSIAPLGSSGDTIILFEQKPTEERRNGSRCSQISIRKYCGDAELLITDYKGNFLFYGRYHINCGFNFVIGQYWQIFNNVKEAILTTIEDREDVTKTIAENATKTVAFDWIKAGLFDSLLKM